MNTGKALKWGLLALKLAFSVGLFLLLFHRFNVREAWREVQHADPAWLWAAVGVFFVSNLLGSWLWGELLRLQGVVISFPRVAAYYFVGLFFNNFLPANIAGDFARISAAREHADRVAPVFSATMMDRMLGALAVAALGMTGLLAAWPKLHDPGIAAVVVGLFLLSSLMYLAVFRRDILRLVEWPFRALHLAGLEGRIAHLMDGLHGFREQGRRLNVLLAFGTAIQVLRILMHVCVAQALGLKVPVGAILVLVPVLACIVMVPVTVNGMGLREGASVLLFPLVGLSGAQAIVFQDLTWVLSVLVSLLGGLIFVGRIPLRWALGQRARA